MDYTYHSAPSDDQPPVYDDGGYLKAPYPTDGPPPNSATQPDHAPQRWAAPHGYDPYGFTCHFPAPSPRGVGFGGPRFPPLYGVDPTVPPPPFACPPPGQFPNNVPGIAPVSTYSGRAASAFQTFPQQFRPAPQTAQYDPYQKQQQHEREDHYRTPKTTTRAEDEPGLQRRQDEQWLCRFLRSRDKTSTKTSTIPQKQQQQQRSATGLREALYGAAQLVSQLAQSCETLWDNVENECVWTNSFVMALNAKKKLEDKLKVLRDCECLDEWKAKSSRIAKRRARRQRARRVLQVEEEQREERITEKGAAIDTWRVQQIHQVEERKKELELKLAADTVLCEVRKKQADVKRMQEVLRSLDKLRRLRKEAASRKGIVTERQCDEAFSERLEQLRCVMKKRTAVYSAEEKALMVMLEGEQEEERRREQEKQVRKERERRLQRKRCVDAILFGDELPADSAVQPFREYYTQAEHSLHALLQIRREWDVFVVEEDHPDASLVPQSWILPDAPSDQAWASALHAADTE